jgi:hypothetical protein
MSVGNIKTYGQKGSNMPYQLAVLKLLEQILLNSGGACPCPSSAQEVTLQSVDSTLSTQLDVLLSTRASEATLTATKSAGVLSSSGNSSLATAAYSFSVYNAGAVIGTFTGTTGTINLPAGATLNFDAGGLGNKFPASTFSWNATGTTFIITYTY